MYALQIFSLENMSHLKFSKKLNDFYNLINSEDYNILSKDVNYFKEKLEVHEQHD